MANEFVFRQTHSQEYCFGKYPDMPENKNISKILEYFVCFLKNTTLRGDFTSQNYEPSSLRQQLGAVPHWVYNF